MITLSFFDLPHMTDKRIYDTMEQYATNYVDVSGNMLGYNWRYLRYSDRPNYFGIQNLDTLETYLSTQNVSGLSGGSGYFGTRYVDHDGYPGIKVTDDFESYTPGAQIGGLSGGANYDELFWGGAWVDGGKGALILTQPQSQKVFFGDNVTLNVVASGDIIGYQWQKNAANLSNTGQYLGVLTTTLSISDFEVATNPNSDTYDVIVTGSRNTVTSNTITLTGVEAIADWTARVVTNGGATPLSSTIAAVSAFYYGLRKDGLYPKMIAINCLVPDSLVAAQTPLIKGTGIDPWTNSNFTAADLSLSGLKGSTSPGKFLNTGVVPSTTTGLSVTGGGLTVYVQQGSNTGTIDIGVEGSNSFDVNAFKLYVDWSDTNTYFDCFGANGGTFGGGRIFAANPSWVGYITGNRTSSSSIHVYKASPILTHTELISSANASNSVPGTGAIYAFAGNDTALGAQVPTDHRLSFTAIHQGLSAAESLLFYNRIVKLRQGLGGGESVTYFITQPADVLTGLSSTATFAVSVVGTAFTYQWKKNGINLVDTGNIKGSQTSVLSISGITMADSTIYQCSVSSNTVGQLDSRYTNLYVLPITLNNPAVGNWGLRVVKNGGTIPSNNTLSAVDVFYTNLGLSGLSSKMVTLNVIAPDSLIAAITPLIVGPGNDPWTNNNFITSDLTINGLKGNGTNKYLQPGIILTNTIMTSTSAGYTSYLYDAPSTIKSGGYLIGTGGSNNSSQFAIVPNSTGSFFGYCWRFVNPGTDYVTGTSPASGGYLSLNRTAANALSLYYANGGSAHSALATAAGTQTGSLIATFTNPVFAIDAVGTITAFTDARQSFVAMHSGLTTQDSANFSTLIQTLRQAFGGGFV